MVQKRAISDDRSIHWWIDCNFTFLFFFYFFDFFFFDLWKVGIGGVEFFYCLFYGYIHGQINLDISIGLFIENIFCQWKIFESVLFKEENCKNNSFWNGRGGDKEKYEQSSLLWTRRKRIRVGIFQVEII